ncbi:MAG: ABC transporter substrate-binding protein [Candidatus Omnitrophica bacterium]|nr:ABC transporter substrate-binding protein [Candidatus Omnitrophota bacterium]
MKKRILFFACFFLLSYNSVLVECANKVYSQRVISLGPSLTKELYLLGVEDRLIGCTIYAPECAKDKEKVGTVIDINLERIIKLKPDLVLATSLVNPKQVEKLRKLKIRVVVFSQARSFQELCDQFLELAKLIGKEERASQIIKEMKEKVKSIRDKTEDLKRTEVFIQIGAKPLFTAGKNSFVNDFIEFAGGINIAKDVEVGIYSREKVLEKNPDVIIIVTMGIRGVKEKEIWQRYKNINAVKNKRIYIIDSYKICSPTPISFVETLKELVKILHPEAKIE